MKGLTIRNAHVKYETLNAISGALKIIAGANHF
jgi:hypothetical protein